MDGGQCGADGVCECADGIADRQPHSFADGITNPISDRKPYRCPDFGVRSGHVPGRRLLCVHAVRSRQA